MATGYIELLPQAAVLPDGSANNLAAGMSRRQGTTLSRGVKAQGSLAARAPWNIVALHVVRHQRSADTETFGDLRGGHPFVPIESPDFFWWNCGKVTPRSWLAGTSRDMGEKRLECFPFDQASSEKLRNDPAQIFDASNNKHKHRSVGTRTRANVACVEKPLNRNKASVVCVTEGQAPHPSLVVDARAALAIKVTRDVVPCNWMREG